MPETNIKFPIVICSKSQVSGSRSVRIPGSKSITNRAIVLAALADGPSILSNVLDADDTTRMKEAAAALGAKIEQIGPDVLKISGLSGQIGASLSKSGDALTIPCGNSGTTIRFISAIAPLAPPKTRVVLDGIERMRQRPIQDLVDAMLQLGANARCMLGSGCPPVEVSGGGIRGGECNIKGSLSSQFLSALLMAAPYSANDIAINVNGRLVSKPYVDMTIEMMRSFGATCENIDYRQFIIPAPQKYSGREYEIEPDASGASYFLAAAAALGISVTIEGLGKNSLQGDARFIDLLKEMGCAVDQTDRTTTVAGPKSGLNAVEYNLESMPDTAQTAAALAYFAKGTTILTGLKTLRVKETDRIAAIKNELDKLDAIVLATDESLEITPPKTAPSETVEIDTYDDHRMAMSMAVIGLKQKIAINNADCVNKTFPTFWNLWQEHFGNAKILID
jgi:3-phosphoshikimate 1-carboxyvinyltransferase